MSMSRWIARAGCVLVVAATASACTNSVPTQPFVAREEVSLTQCVPGSAPAIPPRQITFAGRSATLTPPADYDANTAAPLLVSLHPFVLPSGTWEAYSGFGEAAAERGYFVLSPNGSQPGPRWSVPGGLRTGVDDIGWIDGLIMTAAESLCIDTQRVFAAGYSAGNAMAVGLSCELPWRFRAIAGSSGSNLTTPCPDADPVDAFLLHGTADPIAPPTGNTIGFTPPIGLHIDTVVASFAERNGCGSSTVDAPFASVEAHTYNCGSHRLQYWKMLGAGHTWAGSTRAFDAVLGRTLTTFSATDEVLDFFDAS